MGENKSEINVLVSNIIDEKHYSHCRLCLTFIQDNNFARFHDGVAYSSKVNADCLLLREVLAKILGEEACSEIPGLDAVCGDCLNKTLDMWNYIKLYEESTLKLNKALDNLNATLNIDIDTDIDQTMYIICGEEESQLIFIQNKEINKPVTIISYKCFNCKETFVTFDELMEHNKSLHSMYTCQKCMYTSNNEVDLVEHEVSQELYKCKECSQFRCTEESLKEHVDSMHGLHVCKECGRSFKGLDRLLAHEDKHISKNECPKCGKTYVTKEFFTKHVKLCLEGRVEPHPMRSKIEKKHVCQECGKGYSSTGGLRVHTRFAHGDAKPHICNQCGKKFTSACYLKVHMVTHSKEKNFACDMCSGKFVTKEALLYHTRRHTGEKPYSCDMCNERFVNASARAEHIKFKHIGPTLSCELCSRKFVTKNILRLHMKKHYDPTNRLYIGRTTIPPNMPGEQNMRVRIA